MKPKILFEDPSLATIHKPAGVVVNRAQTVKGETVQDWMEKTGRLPKADRKQSEEVKEFFARSGVVHRLDKDTSGVLLLAKTPAAFHKLKAQFKKRQVTKQYLTLVHGRLQPGQGTIRLPLARNPKNRRRFTVRLGGRPAETAYKVKQYRQGGTQVFSLVQVNPRTGRTHQIRVHFQFVKHPVVADPLYLSAKNLKRDSKWCPRLFLHAQRLSFFHPQTRKRMTVKAALPNDLVRALASLTPVD